MCLSTTVIELGFLEVEAHRQMSDNSFNSFIFFCCALTSASCSQLD